MSGPITLGSGVTVHVEPPDVPAVTVTPPSADRVVVPVQGPPGPQGPPGDGAATLGYTHTQSSPATLVQVQHGLSFTPAGVRCVSPQGITEPADITAPTSGVLEVSFGVPFTGTITVS